MTTIRKMRSNTLWMVLAVLATTPAWADDEPEYADARTLQDDVARVVTCEADYDTFMRAGTALSPLYYGDPGGAALEGWRLVDKGFVAEYATPGPIEILGREARSVMAAGQGLLAVLDGDLKQALAEELGLKPSDVPFTSHILVRAVRSEPLGDGVQVDVVQTVSTITTHPGKTLVGCEYRLVY